MLTQMLLGKGKASARFGLSEMKDKHEKASDQQLTTHQKRKQKGLYEDCDKKAQRLLRLLLLKTWLRTAKP